MNFIEQLIELVRFSQPCLYSLRNAECKVRERKSKARQKLARALGQLVRYFKAWVLL